MTALVVVMAVVVLLLGVLVVGLLRSHAEILRALHGLGVSLDPDRDDGQQSQSQSDGRRPAVARPMATRLGPASDVSGVTPSLEPISVSVTGRDRLTLLAFLSSSCLPCRAFWDAFRPDDLAVPSGARLVVVTKGPDAESPGDVARVAPPGHVTVMSNEAWDAYHAPGSPYFVLVDGSNVIGEGTGGTWSQIEKMLRSALADAGIDRGPRAHAHQHPPEPAADNQERIDGDLRRAGVGPGHPSLYAPAAGDDVPDSEHP